MLVGSCCCAEAVTILYIFIFVFSEINRINYYKIGWSSIDDKK